MKRVKYISFLLSIAFMIVACERDVDFKGKEPEPKIVLNSIVGSTAGQHTIKISESVFLFGGNKPQSVIDLTLKLLHNGKDVPLSFLEEKENHRYYQFSADISSGDQLEVSGESPKYGKIYGTDHIPFPAEIKDVQTEWFTGQKDEKSYLRTLITIKDNPDERNFYRIVIRNKVINKTDTEDQPWNQQDVFVDQEIQFNNIDGILLEDNDTHKYRIFSDELINGQEYTLNVYIEMDKTDSWGIVSERYVKVEIHALSENLFKYLRSLELAMSEDNFSEPVKIYSNIENGYGILGTYNVSEKIIMMD